MADENIKQYRHNGRFAKKRIVQWKNNVHIANKKRKLGKIVEEGELYNYSKRKGLRIIDLDVLGNEMWCTPCKVPLSFDFMTEENIVGLASTFHLKCFKCKVIYLVRSSTFDSRKTCVKFHINMKIAVAMLDSGIGETHVNVVLSALNLPTINHNLLKRYERIMGPVIENVAKESCKEALYVEKEMTIAKNRSERSEEVKSDVTIDLVQEKCLSDNNLITTDPSTKDPSTEDPSTEDHSQSTSIPDELLDETIGIRASFDAGWQKKGSGHSYNSLTGHATAFGHLSGKCIGYATCTASCRGCSIGSTSEHHQKNCRRNYNGSAKSMEGQMAVKIFAENEDFKCANVKLKTLIGDEDSCALANLRRVLDDPIEKWSDKNHATKNLGKHLYALKIVSPAAIKYFKYCFGCSLEKNKGNVEATKAAILNIVPHAFGQHTNCGSWCSYNANPDTFRHKILPKGQPLVGEQLKNSIMPIFEVLAENANKLSPCGSSQKNECANMVIASKAPKARHYGSSSSNDFRVSTAICQINKGRTFINDVYDKVNLSPVRNKSLHYRRKKDEIKKRHGILSHTPAFKKRRRELFHKRQNKNTSLENKEGLSYEADNGLLISNFIDEPESSISSKINETTTIIIYDLETTGFCKSDQIVQIAAIANDKKFNSYILPTCSFSSGASDVTGLTIKDDKMFLHSTLVKTVSPKTAIRDFILFLKSISSNIILAAHSGFRFDHPRILELVQKVNMFDEFKSVVCGFIDTLPVFKSKLKVRVSEKKSFKQTELAADYLNPEAVNGAHNAENDTMILHELLNHNEINISKDDMLRSAVTLQSVLNLKANRNKMRMEMKKLDILCKKKDENSNIVSSGISNNIIKKIVNARLSLQNLLDAYNSSGYDGLRILLSQNVGLNKGARVTNNKNIINNLALKLEKIKDKF